MLLTSSTIRMSKYVENNKVTIRQIIFIAFGMVGLWCLTPLSTIYIVAVSFIENRKTWRKPPTYRKSQTNFIT
jgi:hypothetical protein